MNAAAIRRATSAAVLAMAALAVASPTLRAQDKGAEKAPPASDVSGLWTIVTTTPQGTRESTLHLTMGAHGAVTGKIVGEMGEAEIRDGQMAGDELSLVIGRDFQGQEFVLAYSAVVADDDMAGTVSVNDGQFTTDFTGVRSEGGER